MHLVLLGAAVCLATYLLAVPLSDPDLWWHIVAGRWILANRALPTVDIWNQFSANTPWIAYSWSNELVYAAVERRFGLDGLQYLQTGLGFVCALSAAIIFTLLAKSPTVAALLTVTVAVGLYPFFGLRPQAVSWILFLWALYLAERLTHHANARRTYFFIACLFALWANTHITPIVGLGALALWMFPGTDKMGSSTFWLKAPAAGFVGTLITPHLGLEWLAFLRKSTHPFSHMYVREFQPATVTSISMFAALILMAGLYLSVKKMYSDSGQSPVSVPQLVALTLFLLGALAVQKFLPYALLIVCLQTAKTVGASFDEPELWLIPVSNNQRDWYRKIAHAPLKAALLVIALLGVYYYGVRGAVLEQSAEQQAAVDPRRLPVAALDFLQAAQLPVPLLHGFTEGGYVMYRRAASNGTVSDKVVIDGRTNVNSPQITRAFLDTLWLRGKWQDFFDLTGAKSVLWENRFPLSAFLLERSDWCHVYPPPDIALVENQWSVFLQRSEYESRFRHLPSRTCGEVK